jgi:hypothetical protein
MGASIKRVQGKEDGPDSPQPHDRPIDGKLDSQLNLLAKQHSSTFCAVHVSMLLQYIHAILVLVSIASNSIEFPDVSHFNVIRSAITRPYVEGNDTDKE